MSSTNPAQRIIGQRDDFTLVYRPGPRTRDAVIAAAAEMALADGHAEPAEHRGLLVFLQRNGMLIPLGRTTANQRYTAEVGRVAERAASSPHPANGGNRWQDLTDRLRPIAGMEPARLVAAAAAFVAAADGVVHPAEVELLRSLRETLGLVPATGDDRT